MVLASPLLAREMNNLGASTIPADHSQTRLPETDGLPEKELPIVSLIPGFYLRQAGTDATHVQLLAEVGGSVRLPPILVQQGSWRVIDGLHRIKAAQLRGQENITARLVACSDEEALVLAIKSNTLHGLPLSKADRIAGAKRILAVHAGWSDRAVAEVAGLSAKAIASLRNRATADGHPDGKRLGRDGKRRPVTGAEGRRRAEEYIAAHPDAPLRQVARDADVSLGTAHHVRKEVQRDAGHKQAELAALEPPPLAGEMSEAAAPPSAEPTSLPDKERSARQLAWSTIAAKLASDPSLRYSEGGRAFLRWMSMHCVDADEWRVFIDVVPVHWRATVASMAENMSSEWLQFAAQLRSVSGPFTG
jgi:ParB-like chromosome segregation protein Spo0J